MLRRFSVGAIALTDLVLSTQPASAQVSCREERYVYQSWHTPSRFTVERLTDEVECNDGFHEFFNMVEIYDSTKTIRVRVSDAVSYSGVPATPYSIHIITEKLNEGLVVSSRSYHLDMSTGHIFYEHLEGTTAAPRYGLSMIYGWLQGVGAWNWEDFSVQSQ